MNTLVLCSCLVFSTMGYASHDLAQLERVDHERDYQSDRDLLNRIMVAIDYNNINRPYKEIRFKVIDGTVFVSGSAANSQEHEEFINRLRKIQGVKKIDDKVNIAKKGEVKLIADIGYYTHAQSHMQGVDNSVEADRILTERAKAALRGNRWSKTYDTVYVEIQDGKAYLTGYIDTEEDRRDALNRIQEIEGIRSIDNQIKVQPYPFYRGGY